MCIFAGPADVRGTKLYVGKGRWNGDEVHVLGYQNKVQNQADGPNAMILPFPSDEVMGEKNVLDMDDASNAMDDIVDTVRDPVNGRSKGQPRSMGMVDSLEVQTFEHDIYTVFTAKNPSHIKPVMNEKLPPRKRPAVSQELLDWYERFYPS